MNQYILRHGVASSRLGPIFAAMSPKGIVQLSIPRRGAMSAARRELRQAHPNARLVEDNSAVEEIARRIDNGNWEWPGQRLAPRGTPFQRRVWESLRDIPRGETWTYAQLARYVGVPAAVRAVAQACARNPLAVVIPCHRVIRSDGRLGGYRWGLDLKKRLLALEADGHG